eukprot:TRINITY_DN25536_c0_g1_i2.p1 TRINITY_DN25536_c0_g1~~TRINITY_DN25536_c0_g1_i2.p1  ORF type:complete len:171 (+),score=10.81 TRINITY_DN25536_c0_g1_i2:29-514(+)
MAGVGGHVSQLKAAGIFASMGSPDITAGSGARSLTPRGLEDSIESVPPLGRTCGFAAPGHHQTTMLSHHKKAPKWSFTERKIGATAYGTFTTLSPRPQIRPGPGSYEVAPSENFAMTFNRPVRVGFGTAGRGLVGPGSRLWQEKQVPGPGSYGGHYTTFGY